MKYDLVIFDLDGTLMDTSKSITKTVNSAMEELGKKQYSIDECVKFVGGGVSGLARNILGKEKYTDVTNEEMEKVIRKYYDIYFDYGVEPYEGIPELLDFLTENNIKKGIVTNKDHETALSAVEKNCRNGDLMGYLDRMKRSIRISRILIMLTEWHKIWMFQKIEYYLSEICLWM